MEETKIRDLRILSDEVSRFPLDTPLERICLETHIRETWTVQEILFFKNFTHGGTLYCGNAEAEGRFRFRIRYAGYTASTAQEQRDLIDLFEGLASEAWAFIGAITSRKLAEGAPPLLLPLNADGDEIPPFDMTLKGLALSMPKGDEFAQHIAEDKQKQADIIKRLTENNQRLIYTNQRLAESVALIKQGNAETKRGADAAERAEKAATESNALIRAHVTPRPGDCAVTQQEMSDTLALLNVRRDEKTIRRWEEYLSTGGRKGTKPPEGYTLKTRLTTAGAGIWARDFANREKSKLETKLSLERRTGGRQ